MKLPPPIDWPRLLADLAHVLGEPQEGTPYREPASAAELAADLGVPRSTLRGWMAGAEPKHGDGEALLLRWSCLTGKARAFAPLARPGGKPPG